METRLTALLLALSMMLGLVSCGGQPVGEETSPATSQTPVESNGVEADNHYPVTVETYDQNGEIVEQTFEACPERVVSISQANTELLIALGLTDKIVATAHRFSPVYERMADEYNSIPFIAESGYPSKEVVLDQKPDLIVGWGSLFAEDALGAVNDWHERGVHTYLMNNTVSGLGNRTVDFLYDDIEKLGQIFDIEDKAQAMIQDMKDRIADIQEKVSTIPESGVFKLSPYSMSMRMSSWAGGTDFNTNLTELAGGIQANDNGQQSMEVLLSLDPDVLVILDLSSSPAQEKIDAIKANPVLQSLQAVQNDRFVVLDHAAFYCGGPRTIEAIETLAEGFYPELLQNNSQNCICHPIGL